MEGVKDIISKLQKINTSLCQIAETGSTCPICAELSLLSCIYNDDSNASDELGRELTSLIVDGVQYITDPIAIPYTTILIGAVLWSTGLADVINDLDIPTFFAEYPSEEDLDLIDAIDNGAPGESTGDPHARNGIRLTTEVGKTFEMTVESEAVGSFRITESETFLWSGSEWVNTTEMESYMFGPMGCVAE